MLPGRRLRQYRKQQDMSVEQLARLTGLAKSTIRAHESGQNQILPQAAEIYARALKTHPALILFGPYWT